MNLYNVLLNNKIPFVLHESSGSENVIYCKSFSDYLFNVGTFTTRTKEVILEYVVDDTEKYVVADVTFDNGECYRDVRFKVIVDENAETPYSTINLNRLNNKIQVTAPYQSQQIVEDVKELVEDPAPVYVSAPIIETPDYTETINETLRLQKKLNAEKEQIRKQKILLEKQNFLNKKLQEYKQELLEEYVTAVDSQKQLLGAHLKETLTIAEHDLSERITNTFNEYSSQLEVHQDKSRVDQLEFIIEKINDSIVDIKVDLNSLVSNKFNQEQDILLDALHAKSQLLQEKYEQKLLLELEKYKEALFEEFRLSSQQAILQTLADKKDLTEQQIIIAFDNKEKEFNSLFETRLKNTTLELDGIVQEFSSKLPTISDDISLLETRLKDLLEERKKSDETGKFNASQQKYIADTALYWARRILDLGGGGGSVAVQYANGGTMNGDLNVNANYLSGGVNLLDIFVTSDSDHQTLTYDNLNYNLSISNGNTVNLSAINTTFNANSGRYESVYTTVQDFSASWEESADIGAVSERVTNIQQLTGSWQRTYTGVSVTSGSWDSTYTTVYAASANWQTGYNNAIYTVNGTANQIISTPAGSNTGNNSVTLSLPSNLIVPNNLTVLGNLTALGTSTFQNTIFTTTSALSVVNLGPGPALYVFQAAGPYDVASFYDGDGIEVLHVGNANVGQGGKVGINESFPAAELTVNGAISANKDITVSGGNSNQWNSNYTTSNNNSATWSAAYTNLVANSANYLSGASLSYVNANFVKLSGDIMTGSLTVVGDISATGTIYNSTTAKAIATYVANVGNGVGTSFNLPHNLNSLEIVTSVYDNTTNVQAYPTVTVVDNNTINIQFSFTPSANAYRVVIVAATSTNIIAAYGGLTTTAVEKYQFRSSDFSITSSAYFAVDTTSGPVRATLPAAPSLGDTVIFIDTYKTWTANNLVLQRNGNVIESLAEDLSANISGFTFKATWVGAPAGWRIY